MFLSQHSLKLNPDDTYLGFIKKAINDNNGFCPCELDRNEDTKCPCVNVRSNGVCQCELYVREC